MGRGQRFALLAVAALIAVVAIFVLADSSEDDTDGEQTAATATPTATATTAPSDGEETPTPTRTPEPTPEPAPVLRAGRVAELEYKQGDTVRLRARSDTPEEVHVHGYDLSVDVEPGRTARMEFEADITGIFEIEFEVSHQQIAELKVEPG
jgi:FtsP/CotA-like multicopper oxidase with cupredoxin domain